MGWALPLQGAHSVSSMCVRRIAAFARLIAPLRIVGAGALSLLLFASDASAAITVQNSAKISATSVTTATITSFNPGGAANRLLVVGLTFGQGAPTGLSVTYGGVALAQVPS